MITRDKILELIQKHQVTPEGRDFIFQTVTSPPSRRTTRRAGNVNVRFPSILNGCIVELESGTIEFPAALQHEYGLDDENDRALAYFTQPPPVMLHYEVKDKIRKQPKRGDIFVIKPSGFYIEEWKPTKRLKSLCKKHPKRYQWDENGFRFIPGENFAKPLGLHYVIRTEDNINPILHQNALILDRFLRSGGEEIDAITESRVKKAISSMKPPRLDKILENLSISVDVIFSLFVQHKIFINLTNALLTDHHRVRVFLNKPDAENDSSNQQVLVPTTSIQEGKIVAWDGKKYTIFQIGVQLVILQDCTDKRLAEIKYDDFISRITTGTISLFEGPSEVNSYHDIWKNVTDQDKKFALEKFEMIQYLLETGTYPPDATDSEKRLMRTYRKHYREAEKNGLPGIYGCLPKKRKKRGSRLDPTTEETIKIFIDKIYLQPIAPTIKHTFREFLRYCTQNAIPVCTYKSFSKRISKIPREIIEEKRYGKRAAIKFKPAISATPTARGLFPFQTVYIDHTVEPIVLVHPTLGIVLGSPTITWASDEYSRRILAVYIAFNPPSTQRVMMILRIIARRFHRLPEVLSVDGGREFDSIHMNFFSAEHHISVITHPPSEPRFSAIVERVTETGQLVITTNQPGNRKPIHQTRAQDRNQRPELQASLSLETFVRRYEAFCYETYDTKTHSSLGVSPRKKFVEGINLAGSRGFSFVQFDERFIIQTLPPVPDRNGLRKINPGAKIKFRYLWYHFPNPIPASKIGTSVHVKFDPNDITYVYAELDGTWNRCKNHEFFHRLSGYTHRELKIATVEMRKLKSIGALKNLSEDELLVRCIEDLRLKDSISATRRLENQRVYDRINRLDDDSLPELENVLSMNEPDETAETSEDIPFSSKGPEKYQRF